MSLCTSELFLRETTAGDVNSVLEDIDSAWLWPDQMYLGQTIIQELKEGV